MGGRRKPYGPDLDAEDMTVMPFRKTKIAVPLSCLILHMHAEKPRLLAHELASG